MAKEKDSSLSITPGQTWKFGIQNLIHASLFVKELKEIEESFINVSIEEFPVERHRALFFSTCFLSVAAIEGTFKGILWEVFDSGNTIKNKILFENKKYLTFEKMAFGLFEEISGEKLGDDLPETKNAFVLKELRDFFTHPRPITSWGLGEGWVTDFLSGEEWDKANKRLKELIDNLKNQKFSLHPKYPGAPFFPNQIISYGCAKWCTLTAFHFIELYWEKVNKDYPNIKERLNNI